MLGAVLSDPAGQQHVLDLVAAADMSRPWHGQVLAAMQRLRGRGAAPGPLEVYRELRNDPDLPPAIAGNGVLLADLMEAAPRTAHAAAYAAMVIEGGIRQRMLLAGARLAQVAESGDPEEALHQAGLARRELGECRARWLALPDPVRRELPAPGSERRPAGFAPAGRAAWQGTERPRGDKPTGIGPAAGGQAVVLASDQADTPAPAATQPGGQAHQRACGPARRYGATALAAEVRALRDLAAAPSRLAEVRGWLGPGHFAEPGHGALYAVMQDMNTAGKPVDPVTVVWEAARRGVQADPARLAGGTGPFAVASAREVHRRGLLAQAARAGLGIQSDAAGLANSPSQLIGGAGDRLRALETAPAPEPPHDRGARVLPMQRQNAALAPTEEPGREAAQ